MAEAVEIKKTGAHLADRSFWSKGSRAASSLGSSKLDSTLRETEQNSKEGLEYERLLLRRSYVGNARMLAANHG